MGSGNQVQSGVQYLNERIEYRLLAKVAELIEDSQTPAATKTLAELVNKHPQESLARVVPLTRQAVTPESTDAQLDAAIFSDENVAMLTSFFGAAAQP